MAFVAPIGGYLASGGWLDRLDARVKLLLLASYLAGLFLVASWLGLLLFGTLLLAGYLGARVPLRLALRGLRPLLIVLAFTLLANGAGFGADNTVPPPLVPGLAWGSQELAVGHAPALIPLFGGFGIKPSGLLRGAFLALRIVLLFSATSLLTFTSSLVALSDALLALLRPLAVLKVPTEDIAMTFTIALRFIQLTADEAEQVMAAQQARGAVFDRGGPLRRLRAWTAVLVPLFVKLFRRADRLAAAMETRCYSGSGRTHLRQSHLQAGALGIGLVAAIGIVVSGVWL